MGTLLVTGAAAQQEPPRRAPDRAHLRQELQDQLERVRMRELWLTRQIEAMEKGERPEQAGPGGEGSRPDRVLSPEDRRKLWSVLRDLQADPALAGNDSPFAHIVDAEGPEADRLLQRLAPRLRNLVELKENDQERYVAARQEMVAGIHIARAAKQYGLMLRDPEASEDDLNQARRVLRAAIADGFDARATMTRYELRDAEERLDSLKADISEAESQREARIDEQLRGMILRIKSADEGRGRDQEQPSRDRRPKPSRDD